MRDLFEEVFIILKRVGKISITEFLMALMKLIKSVRKR